MAHRLSRSSDRKRLGPTALVHEAYLRLADQSRVTWNDPAHFLALVAVTMRHILTDKARAGAALKRGGRARPIALDEEAMPTVEPPSALPPLEQALERLGQIDARLALVVECRFFGGMTHAEIASALGVTVRTVDRDWTKARTLLRRLLAD